MGYQSFMEITDELLAEVGTYSFERRSITDTLEPPQKNVVVLKGLRGVGKTTALLQFLSNRRATGNRVLYVSADSTLLQGLKLTDIAKEFKTRGGGYLVLDEIHRYQQWEKEVLDIVNFFSNIHLIVSGSSSLRIDHRLADLSRRHIVVQAHGLCFGEWAALEHGMELSAYPYDTLLGSAEDIAYAVNRTFKDHQLSIVHEFHRYLAEGYFPSRRNYPNLSLYYQSVENVINAIIDQDIASRFPDITEITRHKLKRLLGHIAGQCPFIPNISTLREALQLGDDKTVKRYLFMLNEGGILNNLYQQDRNYKDIPRPEKIYLENTNFMYALQKHIDIGNLRETFAVGMLTKIVPVSAPRNGDIITAQKDVFEIGGKGKTKKQVRNFKRASVLNDDMDYARGAHLPLWLLGFL